MIDKEFKFLMGYIDIDDTNLNETKIEFVLEVDLP